MNGKFRLSVIAAILAVVATVSVGPVHAQNVAITAQYDRASYVPGDSGTLTITMVNNDVNPLEIRNLTVYFPWAQMVNGKWPTSPPANVSYDIPGYQTIGTASSSGGNIYTWSTSFTIPSWYGGFSFGFGGSRCPGFNGPRYSTNWKGCVILGISGNPPGYETQHFSIAMALPTYTPTSMLTQWFAIANVIMLGIFTLFAAMLWSRTRRLPSK